MKVCPTCQRGWEKLNNHQRIRTNVEKASGMEFAAIKKLGDTTGSCRTVYEYLMEKDHRWVSGDELRTLVNGDGPRRARQLRDEYGVPVATKMMRPPGERRQAYYRIVDNGLLDFHL
tara:strand:+ start:546 stop:896 length:351 start_codon:yes stop_codon:yes gene_type:complete